MSCKNGNTGNENNGNGNTTEPQYLTVTYHNEYPAFHNDDFPISGEPPIDTIKYKLGDRVTFADHGTLERKDSKFIGWYYLSPVDDQDIRVFKTGETYTVVDENGHGLKPDTPLLTLLPPIHLDLFALWDLLPISG